MLENHYEVLGVEPAASAADIRQAYLELAKRYHPDVAPSVIADKLMGRINAAYEVLNDPARRARYDRQLQGERGVTANPEVASAPSESREPDRSPHHRERPSPSVGLETGRAQPLQSGSVQPAPSKKPASAPGPKSLDADVSSRVVQKHQPEFQRCYESSVLASLGRPGAEADALARVALTATIVIAPSGHVETASLQGEARPMLESCLRGAITAMQFPQSDRGTEISFPLVFEPKVVPAEPRTRTP